MQNLRITNLHNNIPAGSAMTAPNYRGKEYADQTDTVKISTKQKYKHAFWVVTAGCLGIAGAIFAYIKCRKTLSSKQMAELSPQMKEIQLICKDIFRRDFSAEETKDFAKRYKAIIDSKTPDNDREYCEKLIEEICKDRQTKKPRIYRWIKDSADADPRCKNSYMATSPDGTYIDIYAYNYHNIPSTPPEKDLFESLFHETHHVKQDEFIFRTDKEFFLKHLVNKFILNGEGTMYKEMLRQNGGNKNKTKNNIKQFLSEQINQHWGDLKPFAKDSEEYREGLRLITGKKAYKFHGDCTSYEEYKNQIIEKGAYEDEEKAEKLFDILKSLDI